jgi:hypothetical protein
VMDGKQERAPWPIGAGSFDLLELLAKKVPLIVAHSGAPDHALMLSTVGEEGQNLDERGVQSEVHPRLVHRGAFGGLNDRGQLLRRLGQRSAEVGLEGIDRIWIFLRVAVVISRNGQDLSRIVRVREIELRLI